MIPSTLRPPCNPSPIRQRPHHQATPLHLFLDTAHALPAPSMSAMPCGICTSRFARSWQPLPLRAMANPGDHGRFSGKLPVLTCAPGCVFRGCERLPTSPGPLALCTARAPNRCNSSTRLDTRGGPFAAPGNAGAKDFDVDASRLPPLRVPNGRLVFVARCCVCGLYEIMRHRRARCADRSSACSSTSKNPDMACHWQVYGDPSSKVYLPLCPGLSKLLAIALET